VLDGGYPSTAPMIMESIAKLGFDLKDVKVLLNSEPHPDHAGGLGVLQQGPVPNGGRAERARTSSLRPRRPQHDPAVEGRHLDRHRRLSGDARRPRFKDSDTIRVGPIALTAHVTAATRTAAPHGRSPSAAVIALSMYQRIFLGLSNVVPNLLGQRS